MISLIENLLPVGQPTFTLHATSLLTSLWKWWLGSHPSSQWSLDGLLLLLRRSFLERSSHSHPWRCLHCLGWCQEFYRASVFFSKLFGRSTKRCRLQRQSCVHFVTCSLWTGWDERFPRTGPSLNAGIIWKLSFAMKSVWNLLSDCTGFILSERENCSVDVRRRPLIVSNGCQGTAVC